VQQVGQQGRALNRFLRPEIGEGGAHPLAVMPRHPLHTSESGCPSAKPRRHHDAGEIERCRRSLSRPVPLLSGRKRAQPGWSNPSRSGNPASPENPFFIERAGRNNGGRRHFVSNRPEPLPARRSRPAGSPQRPPRRRFVPQVHASYSMIGRSPEEKTPGYESAVTAMTRKGHPAPGPGPWVPGPGPWPLTPSPRVPGPRATARRCAPASAAGRLVPPPKRPGRDSSVPVAGLRPRPGPAPRHRGAVQMSAALWTHSRNTCCGP